MIAEFINGLVNFLSSCLSLVVLLYFLKFILYFCFGIRLPRFRKVNCGRSRLRMSLNHNKADYEFRKFKTEQRYQYKLEKYKARLQVRQNRKKSSFIASLPNYLRIVK